MAAEIPAPFRLLRLDSVDSTNDEVRRRALTGEAEGLVLVAERQTAGRGRRGAAWFSPPGESLAFSILLRPAEPKVLWPRLALAAGLAVAEALGSQAGVKWPNDVWIRGRKVAGILIEAGPDFAVVGIGVNINLMDFPDGILATSLRLETGQDHCREEVMEQILRRFELRRLQIGADFEFILNEVRLRCVLTGRRVTLTTANGPRAGCVEGIAAGGELLLRTERGIEKLIQADEVRLMSE